MNEFSRLFLPLFVLGTPTFGYLGAYIGAQAADRAAADLTPQDLELDQRWVFSDQIGAETASPLIRARAVRTGTLALSPSEAVYFFTDRDSQGDRLIGDCHYKVTGEIVDSRWWSVAVYGADYLYIPNSENRSSYNSRNIIYDDTIETTGSWTINLSRNFSERNWIPTGDAQYLEILYRIYRPSDDLRRELPEIELPYIEKVSCS